MVTNNEQNAIEQRIDCVAQALEGCRANAQAAFAFLCIELARRSTSGSELTSPITPQNCPNELQSERVSRSDGTAAAGANDLTAEERAALDRLDKPEWSDVSHRKLRAALAVEVARTIRMGAKIENLQDELAAASGSDETQSVKVDERALPPLPERSGMIDYMDGLGRLSHKPGYTADQMRDYARAALAQQATTASAKQVNGMQCDGSGSLCGSTNCCPKPAAPAQAGDARQSKIIDELLAHCPDAECHTCGRIICPHEDLFHFHHDGCPSCAQEDAQVAAMSASQDKTGEAK